MNTEILFTKKENKLTITLDKNVNYKDLKTKMQEILDASTETFDDIEGPILVDGRRLLDEEEKEIVAMISEKTDIEIKVERPKQMGLASINNIFNQDTTITNTKVFSNTIRSGQRIDFEGSIIVLGDVNGGAEVVAEGNIIVLGHIRGFAHAGAKGNRSAFIAANSINPTQLRIADIILRGVEEKKQLGNDYEVAKLEMGAIVIEH